MSNLDRFRKLPDDALRFIMQDAAEAAKCMRDVNPALEGKYLDQVNDCATILNERERRIKHYTLEQVNRAIDLFNSTRTPSKKVWAGDITQYL